MAIGGLAKSAPGGLFASYHAARYLAVAALAAGLGVIWLSLSLPMSDVAFRPGPAADVVSVAAPAGSFDVAADQLVTLRGVDGGEFSLPVSTLASAEQAGQPDRQRLARLMRTGPVQADVTDIRGERYSLVLSTRPARLGDLSAHYWQGVICGLAAMLFGIAVWIMKRRDWGAAWFAWVGVWLFASASADALFEVWNVATPGWVATSTLLANGATLHPFALSFVALFARFPSPLVSRRIVIWALAGAGVAAAATVAVLPWSPVYSGALQIAEYLVLLGLVVAQFWINRTDRAKRPTLVILVASIGIGIALYVLVTILPTIRGDFTPLGEAVAFPLFVLIYVGIGLSIVRAGVFALDGLSRSILVSVTLSLVVLLVDLALLRWLTSQQGVALGLSFAAVALVYLPLREWGARRGERRRNAESQRVLRSATDLAFATTDEERASRWRDAVEATFRPLDTAVDPAPSSAPRVEAQGIALRVPAVAGAPALVCRHADGGRRAFNRGDVDAAGALIAIVERMIESRDAYVQGATEERHRIARDLHDNVSGRLTTSLFRRDIGAMKHDVRDAMADIRTIISGLGGEARRLGEVLADIRHECHTRCDAAGLAIDWPPGPELDDERPVSYSLYRHLTALFRECVSNVIRHAEASEVRIDVAFDDHRISTTITDDGRGVSANASPGRGLANCAQRARALGGDFEVLAAERGAAVRFDLCLGWVADLPEQIPPAPAPASA